MPTIGKPKIDTRPKQVYMGIRTITPFKGMSKAIGKLTDEMNAWVSEHKIKTAGPPFLRYHVIDMRGFMDIEFGFPMVGRWGKYSAKDSIAIFSTFVPSTSHSLFFSLYGAN